MKIKDLTEEDLETMGYDDIAYLILKESGKKMKINDFNIIQYNERKNVYFDKKHYY